MVLIPSKSWFSLIFFIFLHRRNKLFMNMRTNKYILNGSLSRRKGQASLILCVVAAVASAQGYWFFYLNISFLSMMAFYVAGKDDFCLKPDSPRVKDKYLLAVYSAYDKIEQKFCMKTSIGNNKVSLDGYYAKEFKYDNL